MASGKKGAKGNKTAHVLNLLTAPGDAPPPGEAAEDASTPESAQSADRRPLLPPILEVAQANDDSLAQQIQQALEQEAGKTLPPLPGQQAFPGKGLAHYALLRLPLKAKPNPAAEAAQGAALPKNAAPMAEREEQAGTHTVFKQGHADISPFIGGPWRPHRRRRSCPSTG